MNLAENCTSPCYELFKRFLAKSGFTVFPEELTCPSSVHPFVDVAAKMGSNLWAFEYKSARDNVSTSVEQALCYAEWFDYVVVVSERLLDHRRSDTYWKLKRAGAGLWNYIPELDRCLVQSNPMLLFPKSSYRRSVLLRFSSLGRGRENGTALQSKLFA